MIEHSVLLNLMKQCCIKLIDSLRKSTIYCIFCQIYLFFSNAWNNSFFVKFLGQACGVGKGILWKFYTFLMSLPQKIGHSLRLNLLIRESKIVNDAYVFLLSVLSFNTRTLAVLMLSFGLGGALCGLAMGNSFSLYLLIPLLFGLILSFFNCNIITSISKSQLFSFLNYSFAFDFSVKEYEQGNNYRFPLVIGILCGALASFHQLIGVAVLVCVIGFLLVLYRPYIGTVCCVFLAPFIPTMALVGLVIFTLISLILYSIIHPEFKFRLDWTGALITVFIIITCMSVLTSYDRINSLMVGCITVLFVSSYFCVVNTATSKKLITTLLKIFVISGCIVAIYGILQYLFGWGAEVRNAWLDEEMFEDTKFRVYSTLENPNVLGEYLLLVGFVCMGLLCCVKKYWQRFVYLGMLSAIFVCLILTQSRGCWLGFMTGFAMYITFTNGKLWFFLPFGIMILPFILPKSIITRFSSIGNLEDSSSSYRVFIWLGTLEMLRDFWLTGVGMGEKAFNYIYPLYAYNAIIAPHSHNLYLQLLVHSGITALIAFAVIMWMVIRYLVMTYRQNGKQGEWSFLSVALGCGIVAFLLQGMFDYVFYNYRVMMLFWTVVGMAMSLYHTGKETACD